MSSSRRPWFPWYPSDYNQDEKVRMLSDDAELIYRRALDVLWQANDLQLPSNCQKLALALARGWSSERFKNAWSEIQTPGFELLKTTDDGQWVYSKRLKIEADRFLKISQERSINGKKGGSAKAKQVPSKRKATHLANEKQSSDQPQPQPQPQLKEKDKKEKRQTQIPADFNITEKMIEYAISKKIDSSRIQSVFDHFKNHHIAKGSLMKDWEAAWRTWCINDERYRSGNKISEQPTPSIGKRLA